MYKLLSINQSVATRTLELKNLQTQTIDICFDDSALVSNNNFNFMLAGDQYDCKIALFGSVKRMNAGDWREYTILDANVTIGNYLFVKVSCHGDIYYVDQEPVSEYLSIGKFMFDCSRKDLIQVNSTLHDDLLRG